MPFRVVTKRASLSQTAVLEIFSSRPRRSQDGVFLPSTATSKELAKKFNIADKTVRDIWNRRSWAKVTRELWTDAEVKAEATGENATDGELVAAKTRQPGRPRGAIDTVSRKKRKLSTDIAGDIVSPDKPSHHSTSPAESESVVKQSCAWTAGNEKPLAFSPVPEEEDNENGIELDDCVIHKSNPFVVDWERSLIRVSFDLNTMVPAEDMEQHQSSVSDFACNMMPECMEDTFQFRVVSY